MADNKAHICGFVSLIGRPNAGKSTILNALLGEKLAIVADKPQTTRNAIQGVFTTSDAQVIFIDTPGIHEPKTLLHKRMLQRVREALEGRDLLVFVVDSTRRFSPDDEKAIEWIKSVSSPVLLALNKIDCLENKNVLLPLIESYKGLHEFIDYIPVSGMTGEGLDVLKQAMLARLPEGPALFPEDYLTDQPERFLAAELIREKILHLTEQEIPHSVAVTVDKWEDEPRRDGSVFTKIMATIHTERPGQKGIIIGQQGSMLKRVGTDARIDIERLLSRKVHLELFVKVSADWRQKAQFLNELDQQSIAGRE